MSTKLFDSFVHDFLEWSKTSVEPKNACPFAKTSRVKNQIQFLDGSSNFDVIKDWDSSKEMGVVYLGQDVDKEIIMEKIYKARANDPSKVFFYTAPIKGVKDNNPFQCIIIHNKKEFMLKQRILYEKGDYYKNYPGEKLDKFISVYPITKTTKQKIGTAKQGKVFQHYFKGQGSVLDIGGAAGNLLYYVPIAQYTCIDVNEKAIKLGKEIYPEHNFIHWNRYNRYYNKTGYALLEFPKVSPHDFTFVNSVFTSCDHDTIMHIMSNILKITNKKVVFSVFDYNNKELKNKLGNAVNYHDVFKLKNVLEFEFKIDCKVYNPCSIDNNFAVFSIER